MRDLFEKPPVFKSNKELAEYFGKDERTVRRWIREGLPRLTSGGFDRLQCEKWVAERRRRIIPMLENDPQAEARPIRHDDRLKKAKADLAEMDLRERQGGLISRRSFEQAMVARIMVAKAGLLTLPRSLPPLLVGKIEREIETVVKEQVSQLLRQFAAPLPPPFESEIVKRASEIILQLEADDEPPFMF